MNKNFIVPLFESEMHIYCGIGHKEEFQKKANTCVEEEFIFDDSDNGVCCGSYIWLKDPCPATLAHELSHFIDALMKHVGVSGGEVRAYLHQWTHREVFPTIFEK